MKNIYLKPILTFLTFAVLNVCFAQKVQWVHNDEKNIVQITYEFSLNVNNGDSSLSLNLTIVDKQENQTFDYGVITLNSKNVLDSNYLSELLNTKYSALWKQYGREIFLKYSGYLSQMTLNVRDTLSQRNQHSFVYQGLFMFRSLLNGAKRDIKNNGVITFTVLDSYVLALSSFGCTEEVYINIPDFKNYLEERKKWDKENKGIDYYLGALKNEKSTELNIIEITVRLEEYFQNQFARWPQGGQCGCCGNYSGNCYFWSAACLAHDMSCQRCQCDLCFGGCVPSSCSGNSISWYWYLL